MNADRTPIVWALLKHEPVEVICHVNNGGSSHSDDMDDR